MFTSLIEAIKNLQDDATFEEIIDAIYLQHKIERALEKSAQGQTITHEEMLDRVELFTPSVLKVHFEDR